jgi:hypothetical protein
VLAEAGNPVVTRSPDCNHFLSRLRLWIARLQELHCRGTANEVGGAAQSSPPRRSSPTSWSGNSYLNQSGGAAFEPSSHHPKDDVNAGDEQPPTAVSHPTEMEVDNLTAAP